ncbi:MAG: NAD(P)H-hydrate dehydratase [Pseudomonadota bacterium]|nr:NAD(P)H-hydrate dehydratase [Pseudomonadota bacterium]
MNQLPRALYRTEQVRELDRMAIEDFAIAGYTLMQRAGQAAFDVLRTRWPQAKKILVAAGTGNNGGDGYVVAQCAKAVGLDVRVVQFGDAGRLRGDAFTAREAYLAAGSEVDSCDDGVLPPADAIVDALLGTGLRQEVREDLKSAIEAINAHPAPVLAIDVPSGLHSDTGVPLGTAVKASCTISFIGLKQGLFTGQAADYCGAVYFDDLQAPAGIYTRQQAAAWRIDLAQFSELLARRARASHKGHFGHVLVIGGERGMSGAPRMAGEAAARVGAGLVSVATRAVNAPVVNTARPELMVHATEKPADLKPLLKRATVVALGPGLGQASWSRALLDAIVKIDTPKVIDADGLNLLATDPVSREDWVLTPHPGEAARLLGENTATIQGDRYHAVRMLQARYGGVCVLKGAGSLISSKERIAVCTAGNPGMASGGMGDVLTGVIAGLLAQSLNGQQAAELGVCLHAAAADMAAADGGERGLLATDLFAYLRRLSNL